MSNTTRIIVLFEALLLLHSFVGNARSQLLNQPESIEYDPIEDRYLISNYGDGTIVTFDENGEQEYLYTGLGQCVGLHIVNGILFVNRAADGLNGYDLETGDLVIELTIPGMNFFNDITSDGSEYLYITDWYQTNCKIYKISLEDYSYSTYVPGGYSYTNGILYDGRRNRIITVGYIQNNFSRNYIITFDLDDPSQVNLYDPGVQAFDGLSIDNEGNIYVSAWLEDAVYRFMGGDLDSSAELVAPGLLDPADIFYDTRNNVLCIPNFSSNTADFVSMQFVKVNAIPFTWDGGSSGGVAWIDYNTDSYLDLFITNTPTNLLYRNNGNAAFTRITDTELSNEGASTGSTWADFDNDGDMDAYVINGISDSSNTNSFYINNGDGTFSKDSTSPVSFDEQISVSSAWIDVDADGDLDLFIANQESEAGSEDGACAIYMNEEGSFTKLVNTSIGLDDEPSNCVSWGDFDNDGDADLFLTRADTYNALFENHGDGTFSRFMDGDVPQGMNGTGGSWGDFDNDGDLDLFVTNQEDADNALYENVGDGIFVTMTDQIPANDGGWSTGSGWGDYDNDGDLDLFVANKHPEEEVANFLYENLGDGSFRKVPEGAIVMDLGSTSGAAWGDYDCDGDLDLVISKSHNENEKNTLYRNNGNGNNWLTIRCEGTTTNRSGIGARIAILSRNRGRMQWQYREVSTQTGLNGQSSSIAHFGLSDASIIDSLVISWTGGSREIWTGMNSNQHLIVSEGSGMTHAFIDDSAAGLPARLRIAGNFPNPAQSSTTIEFMLREEAELDLLIHDVSGRIVRSLIAGKQYNIGRHSISWDGNNNDGNPVSSGTYLCTLKTRDFGVTRTIQITH